MIRYAITDRLSLAGRPAEQLDGLVTLAERLAQQGVEYLQLREKDMPLNDLRALATRLRDVLQGSSLRLILNGPLALADELALPWHADGSAPADQPAFSASCHSLADVRVRCRTAELLLFGPVFGKTVKGVQVQPAAGLAALSEAVGAAQGTPVLALGGVTESNTAECLQAGAAGVAGIRLFAPDCIC